MVTVTTVGVAAVVVTAVLTMALLALEAPAVGRSTVLGTLPWMVVAGLLHTLGIYGPYPAGMRPMVVLPVGVLLTFVVASVLWTLLRQFATLRNVDGPGGRYVAAAGSGAAVVLFAAVALVTGPGAEALFWLAAAPTAGAAVAGVALLVLGVFDPTAVARMRWVGWLVIFGFTLLGVTVTVGIDAFGAATTPATALVVSVTAGLPTASVSLAWPLVVVGCLLGLMMVSALARVVDDDPAAGYVLATALSVGTVAPAVALLVTTVVR